MGHHNRPIITIMVHIYLAPSSFTTSLWLWIRRKTLTFKLIYRISVWTITLVGHVPIALFFLPSVLLSFFRFFFLFFLSVLIGRTWLTISSRLLPFHVSFHIVTHRYVYIYTLVMPRSVELSPVSNVHPKVHWCELFCHIRTGEKQQTSGMFHYFIDYGRKTKKKRKG